MLRNTVCTALATFLLVAGRTAAEDETQKAAARASDEGLQISVGAGFISSPRPYIGADPQSFPIPVIALEYKRWFLEGIRGGYALVQRESFDVRAFTQIRFRGLEPESSPFLEGMETRRKSLDAGVEMVYQGRPIGLRMAALTDVLGRSNGQEVSAQAITGAPLGEVLVLLGFGPRWLSQNRVDYYYGIRPSEARPERPTYAGDSTINWDLTLTTIYRPTPRWALFALLAREGLGSAIRSSPLVERSSAHSFVASVSYEF